MKATRIPGQSGITLVESLVALVIISAGMLGIAGLYVASLKAGRSALIRTEAVNLVSDMADRIRANPRAGEAYDTSGYGSGPAKQGCVVDENCSAEKLAEDDLARWIELVKSTLPGGDDVVAEVEYTANPTAGHPDRYEIRVEWREPGEEERFSYVLNLHVTKPLL